MAEIPLDQREALEKKEKQKLHLLLYR